MMKERRILLVEDDAAVRRSLQLLFAAKGYDVRAHASAEGLCTNAEALIADCLVADLVLPGDDAIALLKGMREAGWTGGAVLVSGHLSGERRSEALSGGFDAVFDKPLTARALVETIERLISARCPPID